MMPIGKRETAGATGRKEEHRAKSKMQAANDLSSNQFQKSYLPSASPKPILQRGDDVHHFSLVFKRSDELSPDELVRSLSLVESTSRHDYESSSLGWHPRHKRHEMSEPDMRYLLVNCDSPPCRPGLRDEKLSHGFLSFMLTHDSTPSVPVLYIYEIHLSKQHRKQGIGRYLMQTAEDVAAKVGVDKVMLTCFLSNTKAHGFYQSLGYDIDECSPMDRKIRSKIVKADYVIMSKRIESPKSRRIDLGT